MNRTNFEHLGYALLMQAAIGLLTGDWWAGAAFGAAWFLGREHAQAEYRYIHLNGGDRYATKRIPEFAAFDPRLWSQDSMMDFALPVVGVVAMAFFMGY
jgi:hypothetical protein